MILKLSHIIIASALTFAPATVQAATVVFSDDFSSGVASAEFSGAGNVVDAGGYIAADGTGGFEDNFLQNASGGNPAAGTLLTLTGLAAHTTMSINFDLALIDSWDAIDGTHAPDYFNLFLGATEIFEISVNNGSGTTQLIPGTATELFTRANIFGSGFRDSGFSVSIITAHSGATAALAFFADGSGWQGGADESWAIDNIEISTNAGVVPLPAALPLFGAGISFLGFLGWRRKRKTAA